MEPNQAVQRERAAAAGRIECESACIHAERQLSPPRGHEAPTSRGQEVELLLRQGTRIDPALLSSLPRLPLAPTRSEKCHIAWPASSHRSGENALDVRQWSWRRLSLISSLPGRTGRRPPSASADGSTLADCALASSGSISISPGPRGCSTRRHCVHRTGASCCCCSAAASPRPLRDTSTPSWREQRPGNVLLRASSRGPGCFLARAGHAPGPSQFFLVVDAWFSFLISS